MTAVTFHADGSSYQGTINWAAVKKAGFGGGAEKVTEGAGYVNPFWPTARAALLAEAGPDFTPGAYLYLTAGNGAGQADYFASKAGSIPGFVIWVDAERAASGPSPSVADARACVARLRVLYPHNRIGLYAGSSFTGGAYLTFADLLWSPHYVAGSGTPVDVYRGVPASFWDTYGGLVPVMVQFSQTVLVAGVIGEADCSAFRGTAVQMRSALLGIPAPKPPPAPIPEDPEMMTILTVDAATVPKGTPWPGVFNLVPDATAPLGVTLRHIADPAHESALRAAGVKDAPAPLPYPDYLLLLGGK
jgi:GH25 family lysozyme M1 (1,4-beta-N-acetylmuramidase)